MPPLWPSRIKVIITGALFFLAISQIATTLITANVGWLDLTRSRHVNDVIQCKSVMETCRHLPGDLSPLECILNSTNNYVHALSDTDMEKLLPRSCQAPLAERQCKSLNLPIGYGDMEKGKLHALKRSYNPFQIWGLLFKVLASILVFTAVFHDIVLLSKTTRTKIMDRWSMELEFPRLYGALKKMWLLDSVAGVQCISPCLGKLMIVPRLVWQVIVFVLLVYPVSFVCILIFPIRMCRLGVFFSGLNMIVWGLVFLQRIYWWKNKEHWAVFFDADDVYKEHDIHEELTMNERCVCWCEHPLSAEIAQRLAMLGVVMIIQSFGMAFRSLKGLRQARWACLFTVTYAMPVEVFPVSWDRPEEKGGGPIQRRCPEEPVQGEPAFDPFALMDEQPESWRTSIQLKPVLLPQAVAFREDWNLHAKNEMDRDILCCGFPSFQEDQRQEMMEDNDGESEDSESSDSSESEKRPLPQTRPPRQRPAAARAALVEAAQAQADEEGYHSDQLGKWRRHVDSDSS